MTETKKSKYSKKTIDKNRLKVRITDLVLSANMPDFRWGTTIREVEDFILHVKRSYPNSYQDIIIENGPNCSPKVLISKDETNEEVISRLDRVKAYKEAADKREYENYLKLKQKYGE
jgi:hypothetical protein